VELIPGLPAPGTDPAWNGVHLVPVRHHSPACSVALQALLDEVSPAAVLIEGPREFDALLPVLDDPRTRCPVAVFSRSGEDAPSWFFPLCDTSPEQVALRHHAKAGIPAAFIDLSPASRPATGGIAARSLMDESHLAHGAWMAAAVREAGCRDSDELWDRLFEQRTRAALGDWRGFFRDVLAWCALGRASWAPEALVEDGSVAREACMAGEILRWRKQVTGPIVVVTGGFHVPALLERLQAGTDPGKSPPPRRDLETWLVRYSFPELDALRGYASGMPSPAFRQAVWEGYLAGDEAPSRTVCREFLLRFARELRQRDEPVGTSLVEAALVQAERLADLRRLPAPGRCELRDAARSCFLKDVQEEGHGRFDQELSRLLGGAAMGDIPPSTASPALLEDARRLAREARVNLEDTAPRTVRLDLRRKEAHRARERFFQTMSYLQVPAVSWQAGPDLVRGIGTDLLHSQWQVGWSPLVEARLCELARTAATVQGAAVSRLLEEFASDDSARRGCGDALRLLQRASLLGLLPRIPDWKARLESLAGQDDSLPSLAQACRRLSVLRRMAELVEFPEPQWLEEFLAKVWTRAVQALDDLIGSTTSRDQERAQVEEVLEALLVLREVVQELSQGEVCCLDAELLSGRLRTVAASTTVPALLVGAAVAVLAMDDPAEGAVEALMPVRFGTGCQPAEATDFLRGVLRVAPELLLREGGPLRLLHDQVGSWDEEKFLSLLPELRRSFQMLDPSRIEEFARRVRGLVGSEEGLDPFAATQLDETQVLRHAQLESLLLDALSREGLGRWLLPEGTP